jgi:hypothetical protein
MGRVAAPRGGLLSENNGTWHRVMMKLESMVDDSDDSTEISIFMTRQMAGPPPWATKGGPSRYTKGDKR